MIKNETSVRLQCERLFERLRFNALKGEFYNYRYSYCKYFTIANKTSEKHKLK